MPGKKKLETYIILADRLADKGEVKKAIAVLEEARKHYNSWNVFEALGRLHIMAKNPKKAYEYFRRGYQLKRIPSLRVWMDASKAYMEGGGISEDEYEELKARYEALNEEKKNLEAEKAELEARIRELEEEVEHLRSQVELEGEEIVYSEERGVIEEGSEERLPSEVAETMEEIGEEGTEAAAEGVEEAVEAGEEAVTAEVSEDLLEELDLGKTCPHCGAFVSEKDKTCPVCGAKLE